MKCRLCACTRGHEWCCTSDGPQHRLWPTLATCLSVWAPHFRLDIIVHIFLSNVTQLQPSCINMLVKGILQLSFDMKPLHPRCLAARNRPGTQYMLSMHCVIHVHERWRRVKLSAHEFGMAVVSNLKPVCFLFDILQHSYNSYFQIGTTPHCSPP